MKIDKTNIGYFSVIMVLSLFIIALGIDIYQSQMSPFSIYRNIQLTILSNGAVRDTSHINKKDVQENEVEKRLRRSIQKAESMSNNLVFASVHHHKEQNIMVSDYLVDKHKISIVRMNRLISTTRYLARLGNQSGK